MDSKLQDIKPGYGLGNLKFGMTRDEVSSILGKPDEVESFSYLENNEERTEIWEYYDLELSIEFKEDENWRLATISIFSDFYHFKGQPLIGLKKEELLKHLKQMEIDDLEFEDWSSIESPDHKLIEADSISMNFWLNDGIVDEIQWSPLFIDDDTIKWPE